MFHKYVRPFSSLSPEHKLFAVPGYILLHPLLASVLVCGIEYWDTHLAQAAVNSLLTHPCRIQKFLGRKIRGNYQGLSGFTAAVDNIHDYLICIRCVALGSKVVDNEQVIFIELVKIFLSPIIQTPEGIYYPREVCHMNRTIILKEFICYTCCSIGLPHTNRAIEDKTASIPAHIIEVIAVSFHGYHKRVIDIIMAFRGSYDDMIDDENVRNIIKCASGVERLSLYLRLGWHLDLVKSEIGKLMKRMNRTTLQPSHASLQVLLTAKNPETPEECAKLLEAAENLFVV